MRSASNFVSSSRKSVRSPHLASLFPVKRRSHQTHLRSFFFMSDTLPPVPSQNCKPAQSSPRRSPTKKGIVQPASRVRLAYAGREVKTSSLHLSFSFVRLKSFRRGLRENKTNSSGGLSFLFSDTIRHRKGVTFRPEALSFCAGDRVFTKSARNKVPETR